MKFVDPQKIKLSFQNDLMILIVENWAYEINLSQVSQRLLKASNSERKDYRIAPNGIGIYWGSIDEDLLIEGLINSSHKKVSLSDYLQETSV